MGKEVEKAEKIDELYNSFLSREKLKQYKENGKKIIGTLCNNVPEEIIHSFGAVPARMLGLADSTELASSKIPTWVCLYTKRIMEDALRGDFDFLDGIVGMTSDDTKSQFYSAYTFYLKPEFSYLIQIPYVRDDLSLNFFRKELERFIAKLSEFIEEEFSEDRLAKSIAIYNEFRELLDELLALRHLDSPKLSGEDWLKILLSSTAMLKEDFNNSLPPVLAEIKDFEGYKDYKLRIHLSGTDFYDVEIVRMIESLGGLVVSDDLCTAEGYYKGIVEGFNLKDLAKRYLNQSACVLTAGLENLSIEDRLNFIGERLRESKADAIILLRDRGCEICGHQCPFILQEFGKMGIPTLILDLDSPYPTEQMRTRVEAFIESYG
ncbi:MAG: 2-hydroxyacyl-CoA dehydratase [Archaeoglobus sp.]|nr:2-hydroxyacyl-CoA dehydratase [Archaeoglobus sp.]